MKSFVMHLTSSGPKEPAHENIIYEALEVAKVVLHLGEVHFVRALESAFTRASTPLRKVSWLMNSVCAIAEAFRIFLILSSDT